MKALVTPAYTFTASAKTLDLSAIPGFSIRRLAGVINVTRGTVIYAPGAPGLGYSSLAGAVLTLAFDTASASHANTDDLVVIYDGAVLQATGQTLNAATLNAAVSVAVNDHATVTFSVSGLTASGATLAVEASDDNGATWAAVNGVGPSTGALFTSLTADQQFRVSVAGRTNVRLKVFSTGTGTVTVAYNASTAPAVIALSSPPPEPNKATYTYSTLRIAPAATPTDFIVIQGSASKTVRIKRIMITGRATSVGEIGFMVLRRSSGPSGGTVGAPPTVAKHDSSDPAATATVSHYTANPASVGTQAGLVDAGGLALVVAGSVPHRLNLEWSHRNDKAPVLRGTSEYLCVNLMSSTLPAGTTLDFTVEWTEE